MKTQPKKKRACRRASRPVGQTMVLLAITMLFLCLSVVTTLAFSERIHQKIELQNAADATAFSNATATARAFNNIAVMNRAQIAHMVALMGIQSEISYASMAAADAYAAHVAYTVILAQYQPACDFCWSPCPSPGPVPCPCFNKPAADLGVILADLISMETYYDGLIAANDPLAALAGLLHQTVASGLLYLDESVNALGGVNGKLGGQSLGNSIANNLKPGSRNPATLSAPGGTDTVSMREITGGFNCGSSGAACDIPADLGHVTNAAMGSRGYGFVTHRLQLIDQATLDADLTYALAPALALIPPSTAATVILDDEGSGYLSMLRNLEWPPIPLYAEFARAEDYGHVISTYVPVITFPIAYVADPLCHAPAIPIIATGNAYVKSGIVLPAHQWGGLGGYVDFLPDYFAGIGVSDPSPFIHALLPSFAGTGVLGVWPPFVDYNNFKVANVGDNFGQPKNMATVTRDFHLETNPDPWNLLFTYKRGASPQAFRAGRGAASGGAISDPNGVYLSDGTDISTQIAMAHGIAYFHRQDHWKEPPNLLNPYWRSTLVASDIDQQGVAGVLGGGNDVANTLNTMGPTGSTAAATLNALQAVGFKGIQ